MFSESVVLTAIGKMFQIEGAATLKARDALTVLARFGTTSNCEFDDRFFQMWIRCLLT